MANIKSQIKRNRQNERRYAQNKAVRSRLKTEAKKALQAVDAGDAEVAAGQHRDAARLLDKAVSSGAIHRRAAARKKSRLARRVDRSESS